jgi:hypothetical protein
MLPDQSTGDGVTQVHHDDIDGAVHVLPNQVSAIGDTRQLLTSRQVPATAFGDVDSSAQVGATHAGNVTDTDRGLDNASGRLDDIIREVRGTGDALREFDKKQSGKQQEQAQMLAQATSDPSLSRPTVELPNGTTFRVKPGEKHIVPEDSDIVWENGWRVGPDSGPGRHTMPDGTEIRKVPIEEMPAW